MHIIALPGRRIETDAWMKALLIAAGYPEESVVRYRHWTTSVEASVDYEAACLANRSPELVIAKSLGTVVAATAFCVHGFRPARAVLIGTPFAEVDVKDAQFLQRFAAGVETLFIQQVEDPGGSAARLHSSLNVPAKNVTSIPGDDHLYSDIDSLGAIISRWDKLI